MNPVIYIPHSKRLMEQLCEVLRYKHYSLKTEQAYCYWVRFFVRWCGRGGPMRHPRDMGAAEVTLFLTMLANERRVSVSTHNQALSALLFLYRDVLGIDLPWLAEVQRPTRPRRIPSVLTKAEVEALLGAMEGETALLGKLLYGTGMRLMEGLRLRVNFDRQVLMVRQAKGGNRYPHGAGISGPLRRFHNDDLHLCAQSCRRRYGQPAGCAGGRLRRGAAGHWRVEIRTISIANNRHSTLEYSFFLELLTLECVQPPPAPQTGVPAIAPGPQPV